MTILPERRKSFIKLLRVTAVAMGLRLGLSLENSFVTPIFLKLGVNYNDVSYVFLVSPIIGLLIIPMLGSWSDKCTSKFGRRRPFILALAVLVLLGLLLTPNGELIGYAFGDKQIEAHNTTPEDTKAIEAKDHGWGIGLTFIGLILLDFGSDAAHSPGRAFVMDVTEGGDQSRGISVFTLMAGFGGVIAYTIGGFNWDSTFLGHVLGDNIRVVFTLITIIFVICMIVTLTSFKEAQITPKNQSIESTIGYGALNTNEDGITETIPEILTFFGYLKTIVKMPTSIKILCLTSTLIWLSRLSYSFYFTDFVGKMIYHGDPKALPGSILRQKYDYGVRMGCWGFFTFSASSTLLSLVNAWLIRKLGARPVFMGSLLLGALGMFLIATVRYEISIFFLSFLVSFQDITLNNVPYMLISRYHATGTFDYGTKSSTLKKQTRGLGTDVSLLGCNVCIAQIVFALLLGSLTSIINSPTVVFYASGTASLCAALVSTQVLYLDL